MQLPVISLPRRVPVQRERKPQESIPQTPAEREAARRVIAAYVDAVRPVPPLALDELRRHADTVVARHGIDPLYRDYVGVLLNNQVWRDSLAAVPYERRLLLLPKC